MRYSVMILPKKPEAVLLQSFTDDSGAVTWDGFGSFYETDQQPMVVAEEVFKAAFEATPKADAWHEVAHINYFINKPTGLVDLRTIIYFADWGASLVSPPAFRWFGLADIPYQRMHPATGKWLPLVLQGGGLLTARVSVEQPGHHAAGRVTEFSVEVP